jgi:hypothetical protein
VKPLFAKLDQQIKQLIDGSERVAERLFRDLLLGIGRARPVTERVAQGQGDLSPRRAPRVPGPRRPKRRR